jgi:putative endonuclease
MWYLYILSCRDKSFYTGISKDVARRLSQHNSGQGAKYTRSRRPCRVVYVEPHDNESGVRRRERELKSWDRARKKRLIKEFPSSVLKILLKDTGQ